MPLCKNEETRQPRFFSSGTPSMLSFYDAFLTRTLVTLAFKENVGHVNFP